MRSRILSGTFGCALTLASAAQAGNITVDNSFGRPGGAVSAVGGTYSLPASLGVRSGGNLFYSFGQFNLDKGETASFTSQNPVSNVIARVTGGPSSIDGTLECSISNASFYLIDSQGVIFGPDAQLNLGGSFIVTTADEIKFSDGGVYTSAASKSDATLSSAAPVAFGFLTQKPAGIAVNGSVPTVGTGGNPVYHPTLQPAMSGNLIIVAGNISIVGGELATGGSGSTAVVSVASAGTATANPPGAAMPYNVSSFSSLGQIEATSGGFLGAHASGAADAGPVSIAAGSLVIDGAVGNYFSAVGSFSGSGVAGNVNVTLSGNLGITGGGELGSDSSGDLTNPGTDSGTVQMSVQNITISGTDSSGRISSSLGSYSGTGVDGSVIVHTNNLAITDEGQISTSANTLGSGSLTVTATGATTLNGAGVPTGITAQNKAGSHGAAGDVKVMTGNLNIVDAGEIASSTFGSGAGGVVTVSVAGAANFTGPGVANSPSFTGVTAQSNKNSTGDAGNVSFSAASLLLQDDAAIASTTFGSGAGGNVGVTVGSLILESDAHISAQSRSTGPAGNISVVATGGGIYLSSGSFFSVLSLNSDAGDIKVTSGQDIFISGNSTISAQAGGTGGDISTVSVGPLLIQNSTVTAMAGGNGGAILLDPGLVVLNDSTINGLSNGKPVNVQITGDLLSQNSQILTNTRQTFPSYDISAGLIALQQSLADLNAQLAPTCAMFAGSNSSTLIESSNGGLPPQPGGWIPFMPPHFDQPGERQGR